MSSHARLSASAAHRWLRCAGSVTASQGQGAGSVYAAAGTYAHSIAATCLIDSRMPGEWLGNKTIIDGYTVECDTEMVDAVQVYLDAISEDLHPGDKTWVEMPLLDALKQVDRDLGGTADYVRYRPVTKHLKVMDFKFGSGTFVDADDNDQLKIYALGAMIQSKQLVHNVEVCIVQPRHERAAPVRSYEFRAVGILDFIADITDAAARTRQPAPTLVAGEHCKFCPAARTCSELEKLQHALVAAEFPDGTVYDPQVLAKALVSVPLVKERIRVLEEFAYTEAMKGVGIPGFKLVDKRPVRKWKSEGDVIEWAQKNAIDPFAPRELISPAQLEKKLGESAPKGKKKEAGKVLEPFVEKVSSGLALVPTSDDRASAKRIDSTDFDAVTNAPFNLLTKE